MSYQPSSNKKSNAGLWIGGAAILLVALTAIAVLLLNHQPAPVAPASAVIVSAASATAEPAATPTTADTATSAPTDTSTPTSTPLPELGTSNVFIEYILDASGSMTETLSDGSTKIDVAQRVLTDHMRSFRPETNISLRVYGHRLPYQQTAESCQDIELIAPPEKGQMERIVGFLQDFTVQGMTPLAASLEQAKDDFVYDASRINSIVMLSDGIETCSGDPCQLVEELKAEGINFTIHVIGLDVDDPTRQQLSCIAEVGNGTYHDARNQEDLNAALSAVKTDVTSGELVVPPGVNTPTPKPLIPTPTSAPSSLAGKIVFLSSRDYSDYPSGSSGGMRPHDIYVMNVDGSEQRRLTSGLRFSNLDHPVVSPDGRQIAIANNVEREIYFLDQDGQLLSTLASPVPYVILHDWSPDGRILMTFNGVGATDEELYLLDVDTQSFTQLTAGNYWALYATFSPDGKQVAFGHDPEASLQSAQLWVMKSDGNNQHLLLGRNAYGMSWSPNGERIAFESYSTGADAQYDIWLVTADGSEARNLTQGRFEFPFGPKWSPDSRQIVLADQGNRASAEAQIFIIDGNTGSAVQLTTQGDNYAPFWVADN
ncbi:MAG: PD40 domain-containing protein [Anaerolineae bacterium]|nr:PD40 domain-containing protein [Anaerolineae bacterium]